MVENSPILASFTSKTGKKIDCRFPDASDLEKLLGFANALVKEDTYTTLTGEMISQEAEEQFLSKMISQMKEKNAVHILAFCDDELVANTGIVKQGKRKDDVGLFGIAISSGFRNEGIGKQLMELLFEKAKGIGIRRAVLEVYAANDIGISLYKKMGFLMAGQFPKHIWYKNELMDEIVMYKDL